MRIQYDGPHPEVVVDEFDQDVVIKSGEPTEVPDDLAARLLEQSTWSMADGETPAQKTAREKQEKDASDAAAKAVADAAAVAAAGTDTTQGS